MNKTNNIFNILIKNVKIINKATPTGGNLYSIRNMSILSKRGVLDKPQELKPSSKDRKRTISELNPHLKREKPKEQDLNDLLDKMKKKVTAAQAANGDTTGNALTTSAAAAIENMPFHSFEDLFDEDDNDEQNNGEGDQEELLLRPGEDLFTSTLKSINNPEDLAQEYINRLLIDEYQEDIAIDEMFHVMTTQIPEWNDYNNHVLREVQQLEEEEVAHEGVDNPRLTSFWNNERIKKVESIRRQHFPRVESAILENFTKVYKDLSLEYNQEIQALCNKTGLTIDQLKSHPQYSSIFSEGEEEEDELFQTKDDFDIALENVIGSTNAIPNDFKSIYKTINNPKSITDGHQSDIQSQDDLLFENAAIETKSKQQQTQQQQYLYQQNEQITNQAPKLNFSDIIKQQQNVKKSITEDEDFDLQSILKNMSK